MGEEDAKGNPIVKQAVKMLRDEPLVNFVGNVEGRDLTRGVVDVIVTDGFVGNVVLKLMEGVTEGLFKQLMMVNSMATSPAGSDGAAETGHEKDHRRPRLAGIWRRAIARCGWLQHHLSRSQ